VTSDGLQIEVMSLYFKGQFLKEVDFPKYACQNVMSSCPCAFH
jgi:hypothetical protein